MRRTRGWFDRRRGDLRIASCDGGAAQRIALNFRHDVVSALADKCVDVRDGLTA
nr:hypothetical protein [Streptomyces sp. E5N91]